MLHSTLTKVWQLQAAGRKPSVEWDDTGASPPREKEKQKFGVQGGIRALHEGGEQYLDDSDPSHQQHHRRKIAQVQSHSQFRVVSHTKLGALAELQTDGLAGREATPSTYIIFQLCVNVSL